MSDSPTFQIPRDVIEPIIQAHVAAAVVAALGGGNQMIEAAVARILGEKVDSTNGNPTTSDYRATTWIVYTMQKALRDAIIDALKEEMPKHKDAIRAMIARDLRKKNSPLLKQFVDGMAAAAVSTDTLHYRLTVAFDSEEQRRNR